jgi:hypothetical protein
MHVLIHPSAGAQQASFLTCQQNEERRTGLGFGGNVYTGQTDKVAEAGPFTDGR